MRQVIHIHFMKLDRSHNSPLFSKNVVKFHVCQETIVKFGYYSLT